MRLNRWLGVLILLLSGVWSVRAQDLLPACPQVDKGTKACKPMREPGSLGDTVSVKIVFPVAFKGVGRNEVVDSLGILAPVLEHLRLVQNGSSEDTVRIVHIGDSHIRGHIFPRTTGARLTETFGAISYTDMGVNGATCLTFTHPDRIAAIAALKPELLILSFGTNESHNRKYNSNVHYRQMEELLELLRDSLPDVPILMTTPPGSVRAQDLLPACPQVDKGTKACKPMREPGSLGDTVSVKIVFPVAFKGVGRNEVVDSLGILAPVLEHLRLVQNGSSEDTVRIVHIGDSHIRGHIFPRTTGARLTETFGAISYTDMGVNGATCLTFTHPDRIAAIAALKPELLILSFGTNESHNRKYNSNVHYRQMEELLELLRDSLPDVPILMTTPPGSYESFRQRRRRRTYAINPRTVTAVNTIHDFARRHKLVVWDMYNVVGGSLRACKNWSDARLMRPDHVHYLPEGYTLQGELLYEAIIKAYNEYVSH